MCSSSSNGFYVGSEFKTLKSVLIGRADGFRLPSPEHEPLLEERNKHGSYSHVGKPYPDYVISEANASLEELADKLTAWSNENGNQMQIVRSDMTHPNNHTEKAGNRGYSTRDVMVVIQDTLYLCPSLHQSRATEIEDCFGEVTDMFKGKVVDLRTQRWWDLVNSDTDSLRAKEPEQEKQFMRGLELTAAQLDEQKSLSADAESAGDIQRITSPKYFRDQFNQIDIENPDTYRSDITEEVPIFDAANLLVVNDSQVLYLLSIAGNYNGFLYLKETLAKKDIEVIPVAGVYDGLHVDSTLCILNHEKVLYCEERMSRDECHHILKHCGYPDKEKNYIPVVKEDMNDVGLWSEDQNFASIYIGMNLLAVSADTLVVESTQTGLINKLEKEGFNIIKVSYPHMRSMGGGVHCTTLPLLRRD